MAEKTDAETDGGFRPALGSVANESCWDVSEVSSKKWEASCLRLAYEVELDVSFSCISLFYCISCVCPEVRE